MRILGLVLAGTAVFFYTRDIFISTSADWFFGTSVVVGLMAFALSWRAEAHSEASASTLAMRIASDRGALHRRRPRRRMIG